ncbi:hypothetical protein ACFFRR_011131 [Megaselia abdita]
MKTFIIVSALLTVVSASVTRSPITRFRDFLPESRIVGGNLATAGKFPYQVALEISAPQGRLFCGGSIIDAEWILTAAHCTTGIYNVKVIAGSLNINPLDSSAQTRTSNQIINHAGFHPVTLINDIALIRVSPPLELNYYAWPVPLASRNEVGHVYDQEHVIASGWGRTSDQSSTTNQLRYVDMYTEAQKTCEGFYYPGTVTAGNVCTNTEYGRRTTCQGDSGGPLVLQRTGRLIGATSFVSQAGCTSGAPAVFTKITHFLDWIQQNTGLILD